MINNIAAEILEEAAALLETVGHCKGSYVEEGVNEEAVAFCVMGALRRVEPIMTRRRMAMNYLGMTIRGNPHMGESGLIAWNDQDERTTDEVIDALKSTAKDLRNEESTS